MSSRMSSGLRPTHSRPGGVSRSWSANIETLEVAALALGVAGSVLAIGGAVPALFLPIGFVVLVAALVAALVSPTRLKVGPLPAVVLLVLGAYSLVQALPLPLSWLDRLSPAAADVWSRALLPTGQTVSRGALSLDPSASTFEAFKWGSYGATFYLAALVGRRRGPSTGLAIVFATSIAVAFLALGHAVLGATQVYGVYSPTHPVPAGQAGPLLNPNNVAGYLNLGGLVGLGLVLSRRSIASRWLLATGVLCVLAVSLRTASRGGVAALILLLLLFCVGAALIRGSQRVSPRVASYAATGLLVLGAAFALLGADAKFWADLLDENTDKLQLPAASVPLIKDHAMFGVGRGAFESVFQAYRPQTRFHLVFTHPENVVVQWVSEWGLPVSIVAFATLAYCFSPWRLGASRSTVALGALCGVLALLVQNLVDLGVELAGVGTAVAAVLGSLWSQTARRSSVVARNPGWLRGILVAGLAIGITAGISVISRGASTLEDDRAAIQTLLERRRAATSQESSEEVRAAIVSMTMRHPADYYFPLAGAMAARMDRTNPMPWIQRALERGPTIGRTHLMLAEVLAGHGYSRQSLMELKLAATYERTEAVWFAVSKVALPMTRDPAMLMLAVPDGSDGIGVLEMLARSMNDPEWVESREVLDIEALARDSSLVEPRQRIVDARLHALALEELPIWCPDRETCTADVEEHAGYLAQHASTTTRAPRALARLALLEGDRERAISILESGCSTPTDRAPCHRLLAESLLAAGASSERLEAAFSSYTAAACLEKTACAEAHAWVGATRAHRGELQLAVTALERAAREEPTLQRLLAVAEMAGRARLVSSEIKALEQATRLSPDDPALAERLRVARGRARAPSIGP